MQLVECVPNFSEGRDLAIIDEIAKAVATVKGAYLLHKDIGHAANRTVISFAGAPDSVMEAAFRSIANASKLIDMRQHRGEHPRIGATDVCPLIPLNGIAMHDCIDLSINLAKRVGSELKIPVYLYGESARSPERKNLAYLRKGGYEGLETRVNGGEYIPDFGPTIFNARSGATVIGARKVLIAYNLNLDTKDLAIAQSIAQKIRLLRKENSQSKMIGEVAPATKKFNWQNCQAIGWFVKEYDCCQISMNLLDYRKTPLFGLYRAVAELAAEDNVKVTGSEIIGLVPLSALHQVGQSYLAQINMSNKADFDETNIVDAGIKFLNLSQHRPFIAHEKILEYKLAEFGLGPEIKL